MYNSIFCILVTPLFGSIGLNVAGGYDFLLTKGKGDEDWILDLEATAEL